VSAADLEVIRQVYDRFNRGDYDGAVALWHEEIELHQATEIPGADVSIGKEATQRGLVHWLSGFERGFQYEAIELVDCDSVVFARVMLHGIGRGSGVPMNREIYNVWEVRDGLASRCRVFWDEADARAAAGLEPA